MAKGFECGNSFIGRSKKCYTDPETGRKLKEPFTYRQYAQKRKVAYQKGISGQPLSDRDRRLIASVDRLTIKITRKKERAKTLKAAASAGARQVLPSGIAEVDPNKLEIDPKRFQYKIAGAQTKTGEVGSLSGLKKWDANLAGIIQVWYDPIAKKSFVVNGHNRVAKAKNLNVDRIAARFIKADSPTEARAIGALTNIAEGRGNSLDAAKFFRDSGFNKEDLQNKGIPLKEKIAIDGIALSKLSDNLFSKVVRGDIPESRAVIVGDRLNDKTQQEALVKLIDGKEKRGKKLDNETISELAQMVDSSPKVKVEQGGLFDLLGFTSEERSLAVEKAQLQAAIKRNLAKEKKLFGTVGKSTTANLLAKGNNQIDVEKSATLSDNADRALRSFDEEKKYTGAISSLLNEGSKRLSDGENKAKVEKETYESVLRKLREINNISEEKRSRTSQRAFNPAKKETTTNPKNLDDILENITKADISNLVEEKEIRVGLSPEDYRSAMRGQGRRRGGVRGGAYGIPYSGKEMRTIYKNPIPNLSESENKEFSNLENIDKEIYVKAFKNGYDTHDRAMKILYLFRDRDKLTADEKDKYFKQIKSANFSTYKRTRRGRVEIVRKGDRLGKIDIEKRRRNLLLKFGIATATIGAGTYALLAVATRKGKGVSKYAREFEKARNATRAENNRFLENLEKYQNIRNEKVKKAMGDIFGDTKKEPRNITSESQIIDHKTNFSRSKKKSRAAFAYTSIQKGLGTRD